VSTTGFTDQTVRMVIHSDVTGNSVRIRLSNAYGTQPVTIGSVTVAKHTTGPDYSSASRRTVTFGFQGSVTIPIGQEVISDPVKLAVQRDQDLVVSLFFPVATGPTTWHFEAEATTYISQPGDWTAEPGGSPYQTITPSWFYLDGVDVRGPALDGTVVAFGDSITDGHYSTIDGNGRWPDWLALRIPNYSVINEGIGGNKILTDTTSSGVSALNRLDRDMIDQLGVTDVIFLEGINDIDSDATADQVIAGMEQIIAEAHAACLNILGGTLTPFEGSAGFTPAREQAREQVNHWIRTSGQFDGVVDFDKATRDPHNPLQLRPKFDTGGGHLHPNDLGYKAMGDAVNLSLLKGEPNCA
jgi:lysophospholipase L1-like esterase